MVCCLAHTCMVHFIQKSAENVRSRDIALRDASGETLLKSQQFCFCLNRERDRGSSQSMEGTRHTGNKTVWGVETAVFRRPK